MSGAGRAVVVMAKAPRPGSVKTRLAPLLGHEGCAALAVVLLRHAVGTGLSCMPGATFVAVDPPDATSEVAATLPGHVRCFAQSGRHLGERMSRALDHVRAAGHRPVVVIGTDVPLLRTTHLEDTFTLLGSGRDVVFGPARDGGYTLVGLAGDHQGVFAIEPAVWSGPEVLAASLAVATGAGLSIGLIEPLPDLDSPADAEAHLRRADLPDEIRSALTTTLTPPAAAPAP